VHGFCISSERTCTTVGPEHANARALQRNLSGLRGPHIRHCGGHDRGMARFLGLAWRALRATTPSRHSPTAPRVAENRARLVHRHQSVTPTGRSFGAFFIVIVIGRGVRRRGARLGARCDGRRCSVAATVIFCLGKSGVRMVAANASLWNRSGASEAAAPLRNRPKNLACPDWNRNSSALCGQPVRVLAS